MPTRWPMPVTVQLAHGAAMVITESDRLHYPRTMFRSMPHGLVTRLMRYPGRATGYSGPGDTPPETSFVILVGQRTPWRVAVIAPDARLAGTPGSGAHAGQREPAGRCVLDQAGAAIRIRSYTTQAGLDTVDFAAARKLDYVEWDAHWYGDGTDPSDATYAIPAIDMRRVIDYARSKAGHDPLCRPCARDASTRRHRENLSRLGRGGDQVRLHLGRAPERYRFHHQPCARAANMACW
jgi:alpha-glucosidase